MPPRGTAAHAAATRAVKEERRDDAEEQSSEPSEERFVASDADEAVDTRDGPTEPAKNEARGELADLRTSPASASEADPSTAEDTRDVHTGQKRSHRPAENPGLHDSGEVEQDREVVGPFTGARTSTASRSANDRPSHERPTTRLVIRDIDVENFKSYYGKHRIGPFHKTFTAVIGPNGSGKSNVIDSMLFVFGRNAKKIRLEKLSELIHNSAAHPNVSYASVTVNFIRVREPTAESAADPEQREEVDGSELRIKREVFRSGVSQYYMDGRRASQREVVERLIAEGVDLEHNRFLILQGEVEQIALMKPKAEKEGEEGLLEYLDDLIGTNEFIARIQEATRRAEDAQVARLDALDQERKLKAEREALDAAKDSTLAFVTKDNQLQKTLIVMCQLRMRGIEERLAEPRKLLQEIDARITAYEQDVHVRREAKASADEEVTVRKKALAEATRERDAVRARKQQEEAQLEKLKSGADEQERATSKLRDQIKRCKDELQKAKLQQQDAEREATIHQQNLDEATAEVDTLETQHERLSEELLPTLRPLRQALEAKRHELAPFDTAVTEATEVLNTAKSRLDALEGAEQMKVDELATLERELVTCQTRATEVAQALAAAETTDQQREELLRLQDLVTDATQRKYAINNSITEMKNQYREGEQDDRAMEFLLSQRSLKGYYGTLRQLGRIDEAYDIAAGMASNAWGFHVVEDRATATAALEALKRNNMGRATMMVVSEIEREMGARAAKAFQSPNPKARRLFDLITPTNAKFRTVFYQAVRDTLVVSTLSEARETAFGSGGGGGAPQRHRVVTLRGELVEPSGTITGGGGSPRGARLKAARSPQDKQAIKEELQRLQQELVQAAEEERAAQARLHAVRQREDRLSPEQLRQLRAEQRVLVARRAHDAQRVDAARAEVAALRAETSRRREALAEELAKGERGLKEAMQRRALEHGAVAELERAVEEAGGGTLHDVAEKLKAQRGRQEAEESALRACRRLAQKLRATQERREKDLVEHTANLEKLQAEAEAGLRERVADLVRQLEVVSGLLHAAEGRLAAAQSACEDARAAVPVAGSALVEAQRRLDDETRYRQTESAKMADALQELTKFEHKIEGCEEKIRENAELYGVETLQLDGGQGGGGGDSDADDGDSEDDAGADEEEDEESGGDSDGDESADRSSPSRSRERRGGGVTSGQKRRRRRTEDRTSSPPGRAAAPVAQPVSFKLSPEDLDRCDYERSVHLAKALSEETKRLHGNIDFRAVALWRERDLAHRHALAVYEERKRESDEADMSLLDMKEERRDAFMVVFNCIRRKLKEVYQLLTHGGDADMELVDANDPFEGIHFVVRPPKKSWKQISNLSGGEKTLSSLALIFSLHHIKPTPIYVMDEIDAALDFRNVSIVANYVLRQASGAQFIIISLRNNMFEQAHQLVGVCKVKDVTATLVLMPRAFQHTMRRRLEAGRGGRHPTAAGGTAAHGTPTHSQATGERRTLVDRTNRMSASDKSTRLPGTVSAAAAEAEQSPVAPSRLSFTEASVRGSGSLVDGPSAVSRRSVRFSDEVA